jgi:hypothetical protein
MTARLDDLGVPFAVWPHDGTDADARPYRAATASQAAELRARDDYCAAVSEADDGAWPRGYCARDERTGHVWSVLVGVVAKPSFVALDVYEVDMPPATHVLWGGRALCEDLRLRGVPDDWPADQRWISLRDVANGAEAPADRCEACWPRAQGLVVALRQIGASR